MAQAYLKVLWITERFPPQKGGVATAAGRLVAQLAPHVERLDVLQLTGDLPPGRVAAAEVSGATVFRVGRAPRGEESLRLLQQITADLCRAHGHHLVHGFYAVFSGYVAVLTGRLVDRPSLVSVRGNDLDLGMFRGTRVFFLRHALRHASAVCAVSDDLLERARVFAGRGDDLHRIWNGVDTEVFSPGEPGVETLASLGDHPRPWIGFSGELRFKKGLDVLLELAESLARRDAGTLFVLGGARGEERQRLERWRQAEPEAGARLRETAYLRDPPALADHYRAMDLMVFPSLWDGLPNALLESMACGRLVLGTRAGGIPEVIEDGRSGFLLGLPELDRFASRVREICALETGRRRSVEQAARQRVEESFTVDAERDATIRLYEEIVSRG